MNDIKFNSRSSIIGYCIFILFSLVIPERIFSQISHGGTPYSFTDTFPAKLTKSGGGINSIRVKDLDVNTVNKELESIKTCKDCNSGYYYGKEVEVNVDFFEQSTKYDYSEEESIWILKFESHEAQGYQFIFDKFYIPFGGKLFIYNEDKTMLLGAFTSDNNREDQTFITQHINGKNVYLEYIKPNDSETHKISIKKVVYIFNDCFSYNGGPFSDEGAAPCHLNTSCPENKNLDVEIKSTVLILEKASFWGDYWGVCTGALINDGNNYASKKHPYILTANHCYENPGEGTYNDIYNWLFLFRHETPYCNSDGSDVNNDLTKSALGGKVLVRDEGSKNSDYLLLELNNTINDIAKFDIAFAGYDLNKYNTEPGNALNPIVGVHHPKGDVKKLSISSRQAESVGVELTDGGKSFNIIKGGDTHYDVTTTQGFKVEGGSSGSPLFDSKHRIIGTCRGGHDEVTCSSDRDLFVTTYGKFSMAPKVTPSIYAYLTSNQADSYIPSPSEETKNYTKIVTSPTNMIPNHALPEIYCKINSNVGKNDEKIIVECIVNKFSQDATRYEYTSDDDPRYFKLRKEILLKDVSPPPPNPKNYFAEISFKLPVFRNNGTHRYEINVYREDGKPNAIRTGYLLISDGDCNCAKIKLDLTNHQERYALGSIIRVKETSTVENLSYELEPHNSYSCYKEYSFCLRPKRYRWQPNFVGIAKRDWILNGNVNLSNQYTTAFEYISTNPGSYYTPSERTFTNLTTGVHYIGVQLDLARDYGSQKPPIAIGENKCMPPYSGYKFNPHTIGGTYDSRASEYIKIVIADCNGTHTIDTPDDILLLPTPADKKLVGAGNIIIENVSLEKYNNYNVEAYNSITFKSGLHIKEGVKFSAKIIPCPPQVKNNFIETKSILEKTAILEENIDGLIVYPNPTNSIVNIKVSNDELSINGVEVFSINGNIVKNKNSIVNPYSFDLSNLSNGIYILRIYSNLGVSNHRIILNK